MHNLTPGKNAPEAVDVVIEIPADSASPVKYEFDKDSGMLTVDRVMSSPMRYPCHYGFVAGTLCDDGDPIDVLVWCDVDLVAGCVIEARVVGVLDMEDESGIDYKVIAVPTDKIYPPTKDIRDIGDVPAHVKDKIVHFFSHYKDLESGKWVKIGEWHGRDTAIQRVKESIAAYPG